MTHDNALTVLQLSEKVEELTRRLNSVENQISSENYAESITNKIAAKLTESFSSKFAPQKSL